jgi:mono/diheme cytochrome c family protein
MRGAVALGVLTLLPASATAADFEKAVAPVLVKHCVTCHNPSEARGGLDLTHPDGLQKGGKSGPVVVAGRDDESYLIERVAAGSMPPKKSGTRLGQAEVAALREWVRAGAPWPSGRVLSPFEFTTARRAGYDWWAFQPLANPSPPLPEPSLRAWPRNPIDAFILQGLTQRGLTPAPPADRLTYLRRVTFDLIGLPPTPEETDAFLADAAPDAEDKLVERLLASPHYGERWGRHWLDVVRFGESDGFENDKQRDHAWPYRDYVIHNLNADKPYAQFVKEQLAGDVLQPVTRDGLAATGFLVAGPWDEIQNVGKSKFERMRTHEEQMEELIGAVAQTFLGLTVNCARCHDHKFDPIPQADYYRMKAVFDGVDHGNRPFRTPAELEARERVVAPIEARIREIKAELARLGEAGLTPADLVEGRFGQALDARRAHLTVPSRSAFHEPPLTIECWAKLNGKAGFNILVANNAKESAAHWEIYTYAGTGEFSAFLPGYAPAEIKSGVDVTDGRWHHLAMAFDGRRLRLYVDARLVKDEGIVRQQTDGAVGLLHVGAYPPQRIGCDGVVDEVRLSRGLRPPGRLPDGPFQPDARTLALWHFDGGETSAPARVNALLAELKEKEHELAAHALPLVYAGVRREPDATFVYPRGDIRKPGERVTAGGLSPVRTPPADLGLTADAPEGQRRLKFAEWVAHPDNPLTARVLVNRLWQHHFGHGLIDTPSDFGFNGGRPSHPELLDWLAREFLASGGSLKHLHRLVVLSATYRQAPRFDARAAAVDADNRLLWRFSPRRLEAEAVRDAMLAVSGELNRQMGGPGFRPFTITVFNTNFYHLFDKDAPEFNRRTVYRMSVNTGKSPLLDALDCPAPSLTMPKRRHTTTPLQALALMNDSFVQRQAERLARRVRRAAGDDVEQQVTLAYRLAFGREPSAEERQETGRFVHEHGLASACWALLNASEFLYVR